MSVLSKLEKILLKEYEKGTTGIYDVNLSGRLLTLTASHGQVWEISLDSFNISLSIDEKMYSSSLDGYIDFDTDLNELNLITKLLNEFKEDLIKQAEER